MRLIKHLLDIRSKTLQVCDYGFKFCLTLCVMEGLEVIIKFQKPPELLNALRCTIVINLLHKLQFKN